MEPPAEVAMGAGLALAFAAFAAGYLFGRRAERDDWRREPDSVPGKEFGRWHRGRLYLVRRVDPPDSDGP